MGNKNTLTTKVYNFEDMNRNPSIKPGSGKTGNNEAATMRISRFKTEQAQLLQGLQQAISKHGQGGDLAVPDNKQAFQPASQELVENISISVIQHTPSGTNLALKTEFVSPIGTFSKIPNKGSMNFDSPRILGLVPSKTIKSIGSFRTPKGTPRSPIGTNQTSSNVTNVDPIDKSTIKQPSQKVNNNFLRVNRTVSINPNSNPNALVKVMLKRAEV